MKTIASLIVAGTIMAVLLSCATGPAPSPTAAARAESAPEKLRALIVTGGHGFDREAFFGMFDAFPEVAWREAKHPQAADLFAPDQRATYDVIVLYDMAKDITDQQKAWFAETIKEGKGVVILHHALGSYQDWPEYAKIMGGRYLRAPAQIEGKPWARSTYKHDVTFTVEIADRRHPITQGLQDFTIKDEVYGGYWVSSAAHPLLKAHHPESGEIVGWTNQYGKARVVCLVGGHGPTAYSNPNYCAVVRRSLLWASGRL